MLSRTPFVSANAQGGASCCRLGRARAGLLLLGACLGLVMGVVQGAQAQVGAPAQSQVSEAWRQQVQALAQTGVRASLPEQTRVEILVGQLDPRLKLAPCQQVQPYLPSGLQMWGRTRVGLRCVDGRARWNVSLPVTVRVFSRALVAAQALPAGTQLTQAQLAAAEIDIAAVNGAIFIDAAPLLGRTLSQPLAAGEALTAGSLRMRQWFAAGDTVTVRALGPGYAVAAEGQALAPGLEGQNVKIRFENGRIVTGRVIGDRRVEMRL